jgi:hypothetical protein
MNMLLSLISLLLLQALTGSVSGRSGAADGTPAAGLREAAVALREQAVPAGQVTPLEELEEAWSLPAGPRAETWLNVAGSKGGSTIYAASMRTIAEIDSSGKVVRKLAIPGSPILRLARVAGRPVLLTFGTWFIDVRAYDVTGKLLWNYPSTKSTGIDDVWAADLDGDQSDEVIVGFNGGTGLHVLNSAGALQWDSNRGDRATDIGNVWHVSAGDLRGQSAPEIVATSALGRVHIFSADGTRRRDLNPGFYAMMVRVSTEGRAPQILVGGGSRVTGLSPDGMPLWTLRLESASSTGVYSAYPASGRPWLAVGLRGGSSG